MATFHIHEDDKNINHIKQNKKLIEKNVSRIPVKKQFEENNKCVEKKTFWDNRGVLLPQNKPVIENLLIPGISEKQIEKPLKSLIDEEPFLHIEKENQSLIKSTKKEVFPISLLHNDEYREDIWSYIKTLEVNLPLPNPLYMTKQMEINWDSRSILIDWLANVNEDYNFSDETFHLSVNYIDRFLSKICVSRNKFQLVGAAAMMLATKIEEYYPLDAKEWSYLTDNTFTPRQVLKMEQIILRVLKFKMQPPTINGFIQQLIVEYKMDDKTFNLAKYIGELVLLEGNGYLELYPSKIASACIALARYTLWKRIIWPRKLKKVSGYSLKELSPVVQRQAKTLEDSPLKSQQAIQSKYKKNKFGGVAMSNPRKLVLKDFNIN